jgi:hypothetical protein
VRGVAQFGLFLVIGLWVAYAVDRYPAWRDATAAAGKAKGASSPGFWAGHGLDKADRIARWVPRATKGGARLVIDDFKAAKRAVREAEARRISARDRATVERDTGYLETLNKRFTDPDRRAERGPAMADPTFELWCDDTVALAEKIRKQAADAGDPDIVSRMGGFIDRVEAARRSYQAELDLADPGTGDPSTVPGSPEAFGSEQDPSGTPEWAATPETLGGPMSETTTAAPAGEGTIGAARAAVTWFEHVGRSGVELADQLSAQLAGQEVDSGTLGALTALIEAANNLSALAQTARATLEANHGNLAEAVAANPVRAAQRGFYEE